MTQGTVKWFNPIKGIGFLSVDGGEQDVFVRYSSIETDDVRSLDENRRVGIRHCSRRTNQTSALFGISDHESSSRNKRRFDR